MKESRLPDYLDHILQAATDYRPRQMATIRPETRAQSGLR